jgi:predicted nucleic acid-binding protein
MTSADPVLVDTNVLLEATDEGRKHHVPARDLLEQHPHLRVAAQIIREYLVVATRPVEANGLGLEPAAALENVREMRRMLRLLPEERPILPTFLRLLEEVPCRGTRIHDAHVVATAMAHGLRAIISLNRGDLAPFSSRISVLTPAEAMRALAVSRAARTKRTRARSRR